MSGGLRACATAALAVALIAAWSAITVYFNYGGNWTGLFCIGANFQRPPELDEHAWIFQHSFGYDGQFYRMLAHDPGLRKNWFPFYDEAGLRTRRILVPALAWAAAFGSRNWIDRVYIGVVWFGLAAGVWWMARLLRDANRSELLALSYLLLPSSLVSIDRMVVDGTLTSIAIGVIYFVRRERWLAVWLLLALACLTRETGLLLAAGICGLEVYRRRFRIAIALSASVVPFAGWLVYDFFRVRDWVAYPGQLAYPGYALSTSVSNGPVWLRLLNVAALVSFFWGVVGFARLARFRPDLFAVAALYAPLLLFLVSRRGTSDFTEIYAYGRQFGPMLAMLLLGGFEMKKAGFLGPLSAMSFRAGLPLASQLVSAARYAVHR